MNCKQGDLAIVVRSETGLNFGKIVRCVRYIGALTHNPATGNGWSSPAQDYWEIDPPLETKTFREGKFLGLAPLPVITDSALRPIRDDLLDNETECETERVA